MSFTVCGAETARLNERSNDVVEMQRNAGGDVVAGRAAGAPERRTCWYDTDAGGIRMS